MMKTLGNTQLVPSSSYDDWVKTQTFTPYDTETVRRTIHDELKSFGELPTEEYILRQKWEEVNNLYPMEESILFGEPAYKNDKHAILIPHVKDLMWDGDNIDDLEPEVIWTNDPAHKLNKDHWTLLRVMIHTQQHSGSIGRGMNFIIRDRKTKKYLGVIAIASDFLDLGARDEKIGWTREQRTQEQRIKHTAVCSTIVPVQPFGYNFLGGKLLALLCLSDVVQNKWKELYGSRLVGLTTTSLYGKDKGGHGMSQYDNLKHWKKMGYSSGASPLRMSIATRELAYAWAHTTIPEDYYHYLVEKGPDGEPVVRDRLNRFHQRIYRALKIPGNVFTSDHDRGIYFASLYTNGYDFLRDDIKEEQLIPAADFSVDYLTILWKKYANHRYSKLQETSRVSNSILYYDDMSWLSWSEAKEKYLKDVGR